MERAEVSREVNDQIAEMSARMDADGALEIRFLCECGCFSWVTMTAKQYADGGAWYDDHALRMARQLGGVAAPD